eukprot:g33896.t1
MDPIGLTDGTDKFIRQMRLREFFRKPQDVSSKPNETTNEPEQRHINADSSEYPMHSHPVYFSRRGFLLLSKDTQSQHTWTSPTDKPCAYTGSAQFQRATEQNHNEFLRRQRQDMTNRVPLVIQYFLRAEKLRRVLRSLQHVIDDDEHLTKIFPTPPLLAFKQSSNLKQTIVRSKLPSLQDNIDHNTIQPCHGNLCKTCQISDMDTIITRRNATHHMYSRYS